MSSFRRRIQHSSLGLIVILLVVFDIAVYWGFDNLLRQYVDARLQAMAESWADIAARNLSMLLDASQKGQEAEVQSAVPNEGEQIELRDAALSIQVLATDGTVFWKGAAVVAAPPLDARRLKRTRDGELLFDTVSNPSGVSVRRVWVPIRQEGEVRYILQAETPLRLMEKGLNRLAGLLVAVSIVLALLARSLAPRRERFPNPLRSGLGSGWTRRTKSFVVSLRLLTR
jgi:hypothetical protein